MGIPRLQNEVLHPQRRLEAQSVPRLLRVLPSFLETTNQHFAAHHDTIHHDRLSSIVSVCTATSQFWTVLTHSHTSFFHPLARSCTILYKILTPSDYASLPTSPSSQWPGASIDLSDGFIHLSTSRQLAGTLQRFFTTEPEVWILGVERQRLEKEGKDLRFEPAAGTEFGHVYGVSEQRRD